MFKWFRKSKKVSIEERLATLEAQLIIQREIAEAATEELSQANEDLTAATEELSQANEDLTALRTTLSEHDDKRNSSEPWVEVVGESIDPVRGIEIRLDWNEAFIQYLKENGIKATDEDAAVQKWLAFLYQDLVEKLEDKIIENSDKKTESDYL